MNTGDLRISLLGESLILLPERAAFWEGAATLLVADTHWGKAATLRAAAIPIPGGTTSNDLERLSCLLRRTEARRIVLLGDVIHARQGRAPRTLAAVERWREAHAEVEMLMVRGNHDWHAGDPPASLNIRCVEAPEFDGPFAFQHWPAKPERGYAIAGHIHPAVRLHGIAGETARLPCFHFTPDWAVLPAFGSLTGCAIIRPGFEDRVYGIADDEVIPIL
jgi:DNA ligase-associated metallophosphoesterase